MPYAPGGSTDTSSRIVAERLTALLGQQVIVENKPGGSGSIAANAAIYAEILVRFSDGSSQVIATNDSWQWTSTQPKADGKFAQEPTDWKPAVAAANQKVWERVLPEE